MKNISRKDRKTSSIIFFILYVFTLGILWVWADPGDVTLFTAKYSGTRLGTCTLCHTSGSALNPYGTDYKNAGRNAAALTAIENKDSDGDGFTNLQEIQAGTYPGDAANKPAQSTTTTVVTTTILTTTGASTSTTSTTLPTGSVTLEFAHLAAGGGWRSFLILNNNSSVDVNGTVTFTNPNGQPLTIEVDGTAKNIHPFTMRSNGFIKLVLDSVSAKSPLTGWCRVTASGSVGGLLVYQAKPGTTVTSQATVLPSARMRKFRVAMPQLGSTTELGLALANVSNQAARITVRYYTPSGQLAIPDVPLDMPPGTQYATFVGQLVPGAPLGLEGVLEISSTADLIAVGLLAIYDYQIYTTVPIIPLP